MTRRKLQQIKIRQKSQKFIPFALIISLANPLYSTEKTILDFKQAIFINQLEVKIVDTPYEFRKNLSTDDCISTPQIEKFEDPFKKDVSLEKNASITCTWRGVVLDNNNQKYYLDEENLSFKNEPSFSFSIIPEPIEIKFDDTNKPIEFSNPSYTPSEELINWLNNSPEHSNLKKLIPKNAYFYPVKENSIAYFSQELEKTSNIHSLISNGNPILKVYLETPQESSLNTITKIKPVFFVSEEEITIKNEPFSASFEPIYLPIATEKNISLSFKEKTTSKNYTPIYDDLDSYFEYDFISELEIKKQNLGTTFSFESILTPEFNVQDQIFLHNHENKNNLYASAENTSFYNPKNKTYTIYLDRYLNNQPKKIFEEHDLSKDYINIEHDLRSQFSDKILLSTHPVLYDLEQIDCQITEQSSNNSLTAVDANPIKERFFKIFNNSSNLSFHFEKTILSAKNFATAQLENDKYNQTLLAEQLDKEAIEKPLIEFYETDYDLKPMIILASNKKTDWKDLTPVKVNPKKEQVKKGFFHVKNLTFHLDKYIETARQLDLLAEKKEFLSKENHLTKLENKAFNPTKAKLEPKTQEYSFAKESINFKENNDIKNLEKGQFSPNIEVKKFENHNSTLSFKIREHSIKTQPSNFCISDEKDKILTKSITSNPTDIFYKELILPEETDNPFNSVFVMGEDEKEGWKDLDPLDISPNTETDLAAYYKAFDLTFHLEKQQPKHPLNGFLDAAIQSKKLIPQLTVEPKFVNKIKVKINKITEDIFTVSAPISIQENITINNKSFSTEPKTEKPQKFLANIQDLSFNFQKYIKPFIERKNFALNQDEFNFTTDIDAKKAILAANFSENSLLSYDLYLKEIPFDIKPLTSKQDTPLSEDKKDIDLPITDSKSSLILKKEKIVEQPSTIIPEKYSPQLRNKTLNFDEKFAQNKPDLTQKYAAIEVPLAPNYTVISSDGSFLDFIHKYRYCLVKNEFEGIPKNIKEYIKQVSDYQLNFNLKFNYNYLITMAKEPLKIFNQPFNSNRINRKMELVPITIKKSSYAMVQTFDQKNYFLDISRKLPDQFKATIEKTANDTSLFCMNVLQSLPKIIQQSKNYVELLADNEEIFDPNKYIHFDSSQRKLEAFYQLMLEKKKLNFTGTLPSLRELKTHVLSSSFKSELEVIATPDGESYYFSVKLFPQYPEELKKVPQNVIFILDQSRTISEERFEAFKKGIIRAIPYLNPEANFNIIVLNKHLDTLSHTFLNYDKESLELVKSFLDNINYSFTVAPQDYTRIIPFLKDKFNLNNKEFNTLILLSDGAAYKNYHFNKDKISEFCSKNKSLLQVYTVASGQDNYLGGLDMLAFHNHGQLVYSKTNTALPRQLAILVKNLRNPIANNLYISSIRNESDAIEFYPSSGNFPGMYADQPLTIYGKTDRLQNIDLMVQGKIGNEWVNITQSINLRQAKKGDRELLRNCQMMLKKMHYFIETPDSDET